MITVATLDVTAIEPRMKHPTIFRHFDDLRQGEGFIIYNDHDPKPLYYQLLGERGNIFTWDYLEQGPEWWRVKITKNKKDGEEETVGQIAAADYRKAEVFKKMGIDFCCGGNKTLSQAAEEAGIPESALSEALKETEKQNAGSSQDFNKWDLGFLADYIVNTHHRYVRENSPIINGMAQKVAQHHGANHPELNQLAQSTYHFLTDMTAHMYKEENILFPFIKQLVNKKTNPETQLNLPAEFIEQPVSQMMAEHEASGEDLRFFRKITNDYHLPEDACNSYRYLFEKMKEFENDLFQHIHLENNILFPKAIVIGEELKGKA